MIPMTVPIFSAVTSMQFDGNRKGGRDGVGAVLSAMLIKAAVTSPRGR
jgi:hypothetical protein